MLYVERLQVPKIDIKLNIEPYFLKIIANIFSLIPPTRQLHPNSVTQLAHYLMELRMLHDPDYPIHGSTPEKRAHLIKLLIAYNLHDIGDLLVEIPDSLIYTDETAGRRQAIQQGDWISLAQYDEEKFNAPIRGNIIARAIQLALGHVNGIPQAYVGIIQQLNFNTNLSMPLNPQEKELLDLIALVAYQHHEYYDGKGWPRGIELNPCDATMDVTFFDFIAGWFVNKMTRGANPQKIMASTPVQVLEAIDNRQAESLRRTPGGEPMYNRFWVEFMREHLDKVNEIVAGIFPDVKNL